jgi:chloride channel 2
MAAPIFRHLLWLLLLAVGLASSVLGILVDYAIDLGSAGRHWLPGLLPAQYPTVRFCLWAAWSVGMTLSATQLTAAWSGEAKGSGIPQMKAILAGGLSTADAERYLSPRCLGTKVAGLVMAKAAGLSIGKEGPWVHISAALAHNLAQLPTFAHLGVDKESWRQIIAAGFAAGTAANFGAPIGGVLFSIEVTATHYPVSAYIKGFACSVSGAFFMRFLGGTSAHKGAKAGYNSGGALFTVLDNDGNHKVFEHERDELFFFMTLGILGGLLGAAFVAAHRCIFLHTSAFRSSHASTFTVCVALLSALCSYPALMGDYMALGDKALVEDMLSMNELHESAFVHGQHWGASGHYRSVPQALATLALIRFLLTTLDITLPLPNGVYMPVFIVGCAIGRLYGYYVSLLFSSGWWSAAGRCVLFVCLFICFFGSDVCTCCILWGAAARVPTRVGSCAHFIHYRPIVLLPQRAHGAGGRLRGGRGGRPLGRRHAHSLVGGVRL